MEDFQNELLGGFPEGTSGGFPERLPEGIPGGFPEELEGICGGFLETTWWISKKNA